MKSAYELAMERLEKESGPGKQLNDEQRAALAEIDRRFDAKAAELRLSFESRIAAAPYAERPGLQENLHAELRTLEEKRQAEKDAVWAS